MTATNVLNTRARFQWETNSAPSQAYNCGPTCASRIAGFYNDNTPGIEATRRLVMACCRATTYQQQADMLTKRGVPSYLGNITSLGQLHALVDSGRRPVILAVLMSRVPYSVRGHSFTGWHAIVCLTGTYHNGVRGFLINDPNFSAPGGYRTDPTGGKRFYSDAVIQSAFLNYYQHWAIVPYNPKPLPVVSATRYVTFNTGVYVSLRLSPDARTSGTWAVANWAKNEIRQVSNNKWIGHVTARRTLYAVVNGYRTDGTRQTYNKLRLAGTGRYEYVDSRFMHRV